MLAVTRPGRSERTGGGDRQRFGAAHPVPPDRVAPTMRGREQVPVG
jgi:hypothetical protein